MVYSVTSGSSRFKLVVIYRPQLDEEKKSTTARFFEEFTNLLEILIIDSTHFLIGGDFNFHWDVQSDPNTMRLKCIFDTFGLAQHVTEPKHM